MDWEPISCFHPSRLHLLEGIEFLRSAELALEIRAAQRAIHNSSVAGRGEDGIDADGDAAFEIVALHAVLCLDVTDNGLDRCTTFHLAPDRSRDAADLPRDPDPEPMRVVVDAVPFADMDAARLPRR